MDRAYKGFKRGLRSSISFMSDKKIINGKKILVVGGAGYIGSFTSHELVKIGALVTIFDNLSSGHTKAIPASAKLIQGDLGDPESINAALSSDNFDAVLYFASLINVGDSVKDPGTYWRVNVGYTIDFIERARRVGIKNFVFSSSAAVYGVPQSALIESHQKLPVNPYGETKLAVEKFLSDLGSAKLLNSVALRYFNACGAAEDGSLGEDHNPETHLVPNIVKAGLGLLSTQFTIFGKDYPTRDGTCIRDYIHVLDLAEAHLLGLAALLSGKCSGFSAFNVGTGHGVSNKEMLEAAAKVIGKEIPHVYGERRAGDPAELVADSTLIQKTFGWKAKFIKPEEMLKGVVAWFAKNPKGYNGA